MKSRVLTVGAYERDNFGDLLFFLLTRKYLEDSGAEVVAGSILDSRIPGSAGADVHAYPHLLRSTRWDGVWVVGGEIGGVRVDDALGMSLPVGERQVFRTASRAGQSFVARYLTGQEPKALAYLPDLAEFSLNSTTPLIANSIGISNVGYSDDEEMVARFDRILRSAEAIVVREQDSATYAHDHGLDVSVGPDMVHAIADLDGFRLDDLARPRRAPYAVVQINAEILSKYGADAAARGIADLSQRLDVDIVLFAAGTAPGHDSMAQYFRVLALAQSLIKGRTIEILQERDPRALVGYIANATMWLGTSLHGRIISSSFEIPRVTLENDKVARYVAAWDDGFPSSVHPDAMAEAAERAIAADDESERARSRLLRERAHENTLALIGALT